MYLQQCNNYYCDWQISKTIIIILFERMLYAVRCLKSNEDMILAPSSARIISSFDFKHRTAYNILSYDIPFTGKHEPNKLTCSPLCDFIAQLVRALHRHRRGHGFESR